MDFLGNDNSEDDSFYGNAKEATPMMYQYLEVKRRYTNCLLLFRMGDFFELFFDDAKKAAAVLNIALTHRGKLQNEDVPMCGIPVAALENYLGRLVRAGYKVAICDQVENPEDAKKRGYKAIVKREVIRVITPGTIIEDTLLDKKSNNFLMAIVPDISTRNDTIKTISFSAIDISTGDFFVNTVIKDDFSGIISIYQPQEVLMPSRLENKDFANYVASLHETHFSFLPDTKFNPHIEKERLQKYFKVHTLESFGISSNNELAACGALLEYLLITQKTEMPSLPPPKKVAFSGNLIIDAATVKSLGIISSIGTDRSLLGALDKTVTPFGARTLASRIITPIISVEKINRRLDCVEYFVKDQKLCESLSSVLSQSSDFERAINRIKFNKFSPKNVGDIRELLHIIEQMKVIISDKEIPCEDEGYSFANTKDFSELQKTLDTALIEYSQLPNTSKNNSGVIAQGFSKKLDELRYMKDHSESLFTQLQQKYISETGINTLRIKENGVLGWYVEIPLSQAGRMPPKFWHKQTLVGNVRYTTQELNDLQSKMYDAFDKWNALEQKLYDEVVQEILKNYDDILYAIKCMACIDVYTCLAGLAIERGYVRPTITDDPVLEIDDGKHPVLSLYSSEFTGNGCDLDLDHRVALLTGPNMAGKSTYLRQNALIIIMAQIGCYIPAKSARIGVVNRLFSRVGASDDIVRGRSTFMVEMIETATILNQSTEKSFVILDEVGRGTSTYDGLSIAWAVMEHLYRVTKCRVLFATHYRELAQLQNTLTNMRCKTLKVQEWNGEVVFYHKIIDGIADKSYGIHVASIAGIPKSVIKRAKQLLKKFEEDPTKPTERLSQATMMLFDDLDDIDDEGPVITKFSAAAETTNEDEKCETTVSETVAKVQKILSETDLNNITPLQALNILGKLKEVYNN